MNLKRICVMYTVQETCLFIIKIVYPCMLNATIDCVMCLFVLCSITIFIVTGREESDNDHQRLVESGKTVLILFWANLSPAP